MNVDFDPVFASPFAALVLADVGGEPGAPAACLVFAARAWPEACRRGRLLAGPRGGAAGARVREASESEVEKKTSWLILTNLRIRPRYSL